MAARLYADTGMEDVITAAKGWLLSDVVKQLLRQGVQQGRMAAVCERAAAVMAQRRAQLMRRHERYLQPALFIVLGAGVLYIVSALYVPLFSLFDQVGQASHLQT